MRLSSSVYVLWLLRNSRFCCREISGLCVRVCCRCRRLSRSLCPPPPPSSCLPLVAPPSSALRFPPLRFPLSVVASLAALSLPPASHRVPIVARRMRTSVSSSDGRCGGHSGRDTQARRTATSRRRREEGRNRASTRLTHTQRDALGSNRRTLHPIHPPATQNQSLRRCFRPPPLPLPAIRE